MSNGVIIFVEGDTEGEIYNKFRDMLHSMSESGRFPIDKLIIRNLKGIGNYKNRAIRVFTKEILSKNPDIEFDIFLCYDTDVFDFSPNPPVDWDEVENSLKASGARSVSHIKARHSIEDWIMHDIEGICNYLKLPENTKLNGGNGLKKIEYLFKKANKVYVKGSKIKGLVDSLDIRKIMCNSCSQLKSLCKKLGVNCKTKK